MINFSNFYSIFQEFELVQLMKDIYYIDFMKKEKALVLFLTPIPLTFSMKLVIGSELIFSFSIF